MSWTGRVRFRGPVIPLRKTEVTGPLKRTLRESLRGGVLYPHAAVEPVVDAVHAVHAGDDRDDAIDFGDGRVAAEDHAAAVADDVDVAGAVGGVAELGADAVGQLAIADRLGAAHHVPGHGAALGRVAAELVADVPAGAAEEVAGLPGEARELVGELRAARPAAVGVDVVDDAGTQP